MKRLTILSILLLPLLLAGQQTIIIDHSSVDLWDDIPQAYLDTIKKRWISIAGESHSRAYRVGLQMVEDLDAAYAVSVTESGTPEAYTTSNLRASRATWGDYNSSSGWIYGYGEEDWWTNSTALSRTKAGITYCNSNDLTIGYMGFGWCYDMSEGQASAVDPVYGCAWYGWSEGVSPSYNPWGLDDADNALTGNTINMDTYIQATEEYVDYCDSINTTIFFTTATIDDYDGNFDSERMYQAYLKHEHLRDHVIANGGVLFDYADILCYDDGATTPNTMTWNGTTFQAITTTNLGNGNLAHIDSAGALRLGKALWVMMATIEGWGSTSTPTSGFLLQDTACIYENVGITYTGNASGTATYNWDFDGATIISGSGQGPYTVEWPSLGDKTVSLYVEESGVVSDTSTSDIYICALTSNFNLQDTTCIAHTVDISYTGNASASSIYHWDFDGATIISGSGQGPYTVQWPSVGDKTVSLCIEESSYISDTTTNDIYIEYLTSAYQLPDTSCRSCPVDIIYTGNASDTAAYDWDFDGATIISGSGQGPYVVEWPSAGDKTVSCYVEESGFTSDTTTNDIYIVFLTSDFLLQDTACVYGNVDITYAGNASAAATYNWDFDGAAIISGSGQGPYTVEWTDLGDKTVSLYVEESGYVSDTATNDIYIENLTSEFQLQDTAGIFSAIDIVYAGNASAAATYNWDFDGATIISGSGQGPYTVEWPSAGDKTVSLYVEEPGFVSDTTTNDILIVYLTSDFQLQDAACISSPVDITYTGNASASATYHWDFDGATIISGSAQGPYTVEWPGVGDKTVSLYVEESSYISDTTTNNTYIADYPVFTIIPYPNDTVTTLDTITLTGDITSVSYLWSTGDTTQSIYVTNTCGTAGGCQYYWLWVTNETGCTSVDSITVAFEGPTALSEFPNEIETIAYPNPFSDNLNIELSVAEKGQYIFEVINSIGLPVIQELRYLKPGKQKIALDMNHVYPGIYILTVKSDDGQLGVKKIIKSSN